MPAGLWLFSYLFIIDSVWGNYKRSVYKCFLCTLPIMAITSELLQYFGILSGTFDFLDLMSYISAIFLFIFIKKTTVMKSKSILSMLILLAFAVLGGGSVNENGNLESWVWLVIAAFAIIFTIAIVSASEEESKKRVQEENARLEREEKLRIKKEEYNSQKQLFLAENGTPSKTLIINEYDINSEINVYENSKKIFILGREFLFKDVMSCTFSDSPRVIKGKMIAVTKSKNGSVIGRSIVGDVVAGPAGAIIGGTTAKKHTEYIQEDDKTVHDYTVVINMNSISEPIIRIHTGENGKLTNEIVGLMNVIISRK